MLCQRCQKSLRSSECIKCDLCESRFHIKCLSGNIKNFELECGDRGFHWVCATCQKPASKTNIKEIEAELLFNAINALTEKMELVNKIQLPKLNNDLLQIKTITDCIIKQNENILLKINELKTDRRNVDHTKTIPTKYRSRNINLSPRSNRCGEKTPNLCAEKVRYRTRRKSYPIFKMLLQLNRKLNQRRAHKRK